MNNLLFAGGFDAILPFNIFNVTLGVTIRARWSGLDATVRFLSMPGKDVLIVFREINKVRRLRRILLFRGLYMGFYGVVNSRH